MVGQTWSSLRLPAAFVGGCCWYVFQKVAGDSRTASSADYESISGDLDDRNAVPLSSTSGAAGSSAQQLSVLSWLEWFPFLWGYIIFVTLLHMWEHYLNFRQLRRYRNEQPPPEIAEIVSADEFRNSNVYSADKMRFQIVQEWFSFVVSTILTLTFFYPMVWRWCGHCLGIGVGKDAVEAYKVDKWAEYKQSLLFAAVSIVESEIFGTPFELYHDFVVEERHGFNKKTLRLFVTDKVKKWCLEALIGAPVLCGVIWVVKSGGEKFYIWLWCFMTVLMAVMMIAYPNVIAPLFNKFEPLKDQELKGSIEEMASTLKFPLGKVYEIDGSKRSAHSNAYFYGLWWSKQIVLYDTLMHLPHPRILAILGHELGHWKLGHTARMLGVSLLNMFLMLYCYGLCMYSDNMLSSFGYDIEPKPVIISLSLFTNILSPINTVTQLAMTLLVRMHEFQADAFSHGMGFGEPLQQGLIDIHKENKADLDPDTWYSWYHYSHPPLKERLLALKALDARKADDAKKSK